jgi:3-dehydroquinate synthetase
MLVAGELSKNLGLLDQSELKLLRQAIGLCGPLPPARDVDEIVLMNALTRDKKQIAGQVQWILLNGIGHPRIVNGKEISPLLFKQSVREVFKNNRGL